ncbi:MAG TPA: hypothetical protein VFB54_00420 [Burkholderiales bacterium]|nr:hypothetical protein [Burkholderiales bacterium]
MTRRRFLLATALGGLCGCVASRSRPLHAAAHRRRELHRGDSEIALDVPAREQSLPDAMIDAWIERAALAVSTYYGRFPVERLRVVIDATEGSGPAHGMTYGFMPPLIRMQLGRDTKLSTLERDWVMTHEMVHLALPRLADRHRWLEEGAATYVEPIARAQAGQLEHEQVWRDLVHGLPHGLPRAGDKGLDHTPTWGRTYWGGALFYLLADIEIRKQTDNRIGLQHALRGVLSAGGNITEDWPIMRVLQVADAAINRSVLVALYMRMADRPVDVDLDALWRELGVEQRENSVALDDRAALAAVRRSITSS